MWIGLSLKKLFDEGVAKRNELWITLKLGCSDHASEDFPMVLDKTWKELQLEYIDLYLIHWLVSMKKGSVGFDPENLSQPDIPNTWKAMECRHDSGKARAIWLSHISIRKLGDLLEVAWVPPAVSQVELHPTWQQPKLHDFFKLKGVHHSMSSPLGYPGTGSIKAEVLKSPVVLVSMAETLGKTPAQVTLPWGLQTRHSVLPKSTTESRIKDNFDILDCCIPDNLIDRQVPRDSSDHSIGEADERPEILARNHVRIEDCLNALGWRDLNPDLHDVDAALDIALYVLKL